MRTITKKIVSTFKGLKTFKLGLFFFTLVILMSFKDIKAKMYYGSELGIGISRFSEETAIFPNKSVHVRFKNFIIQGRIIHFNDTKDIPSPIHFFLEPGLLSGLMLEINEIIKIKILSGVSFVLVTETVYLYNTSEYEFLSYHTIGVPMNVDLLFLPWPKIGFGLSIISNFNKQNSYAGLAISIHFGKLRD